jgi:hypothetical protein
VNGLAIVHNSPSTQAGGTADSAWQAGRRTDVMAKGKAAETNEDKKLLDTGSDAYGTSFGPINAAYWK